jgi:hypothetical protein
MAVRAETPWPLETAPAPDQNQMEPTKIDDVPIPFCLSVDRLTHERWLSALKRYHEMEGLPHLVDRHTYAVALEMRLEEQTLALEVLLAANARTKAAQMKILDGDTPKLVQSKK